MRTRKKKLVSVLLMAALLLTACGEKPLETVRTPVTQQLLPAPPGENLTGNALAVMDLSATAEGYIQVCYNGQAQKAKVQLTLPDGTVYTYTLLPGAFAILPLTGGSGDYGITVLENAFENAYAVVYTGQIPSQQENDFKPYLYPNQYVWYTEGSKVHAIAAEISQRSRDDLHFVENVYTYVVESVTYDHELAANVPAEYLPDLDKVIATGKGICLDYAALMTALLRSQGIPTKLVVGYSGQVYHAWISVYLEETGWVDGTIFFDGTTWSRMDPTLAAANRGPYVKDYDNNSGNYLEKYFY